LEDPVAEQYVALLRGINVGRAKRVAMADLRDAVSSLGYSDVKTLLNSGNVVFTAEKAPKPEQLQEVVAKLTGVSSDVILLTAKQVARAVDENPLADVASDPSRLQVMFFSDDSDGKRLRKLVDDSWAPEQLAVGRHAAYLWCPDGIISSPLMAAVGEQELQGIVTTRNWRTVTKLRALLD
jgi:uncharacterized protein (DUF1697 family)